jgi:hypothetical protein
MKSSLTLLSSVKGFIGLMFNCGEPSAGVAAQTMSG